MCHEASSLVYCNNVTELTKLMGIKYDDTEWSFIDSSNRSLMAVLLNNRNELSSIPVGHLVEIKDPHNTMEHLLSALNFQEHKWLICGDL